MKKIEVSCLKVPAAARLPLERAARAALAAEKFPGQAQINILLVSDAAIRKLNRRFRGVNRITDIISFKIADRPLCGDLVIGRERSKKQARRIGHSWGDELSYLVVHGVLHLLGYSDYAPRTRARMFRKQDAIWNGVKAMQNAK